MLDNHMFSWLLLMFKKKSKNNELSKNNLFHIWSTIYK